MKAVIRLDVPNWQIGQDVTVYFPDTMMKKGKCEEDIVHCKDCKHRFNDEECHICNLCGRLKFPDDDWFCADGEAKDEK